MPDRSSGSKADSKADYRTVAAIAAAKRLDPAWLAELGIADVPGGGIAIPYYGEDGHELFCRQRGRPGGPRFRQPAGVPLRPYGLWRLDRCRRAGHAWLCEGESDTWALWAAELPALGLPGKDAATAMQQEDVTDLADLFVLPDNEPAGDAEKLLAAVAKRLAAFAWPGRLWRVPVPNSFKDVSDWRVRDPERFREELAAALNNRERVEVPAVPSKTAGKPERKAAATRLVELVEDAGIDLYHSDDQAAFADVKVEGRRETVAVRGAAFKLWLSRLFFTVEGRAAGSQAIHDALSVIESMARFDGPERAVHVRLAEHDGKFYLDLGDRQWRVAEIDAAGWRIVEAPAVRFRRPRGMLPLPEPQPGGSVEELRRFVNVADNDHWRLLMAWLLAALRPCGPYPLLVLSGQQGTAKSTTARLLRALIDPNKSALRSEPKETRDLMIAATNSWCLCFDNLSALTPWLSDALCRLATGGGFATRELYTDAEESLFDAQRPVLLNGIEDLATRGDLLDRAIPLNLPPIPEDKRRAERSLWRDFEAAQPRILGALLTAVARGIRELPNVRLAGLPRMADFAEWAVAVETTLGWPSGSFLAAYGENRTEASELALESSPLVPFLRQLVEAKGEWTGTASALLAELRELAGDAAKSRDWPGNARGLSGRLKRLAPNLRAVGIVVEWEREEGRKRTRVLRLSCQQDKVRDFASVASEDAETPGNSEANADANGRKTGRKRPCENPSTGRKGRCGRKIPDLFLSGPWIDPRRRPDALRWGGRGMSDALTQTAAFVGWYRTNRRQPWRPVVQAGSEDAALDKLLREPPGDKIVLPVGRDPNQREVGP